MSQPLVDQLQQRLGETAEATVDGVNAVQHRLSEQLEVTRFLCTQEAQASGGIGVRLSLARPPAATGTRGGTFGVGIHFNRL